ADRIAQRPKSEAEGNGDEENTLEQVAVVHAVTRGQWRVFEDIDDQSLLILLNLVRVRVLQHPEAPTLGSSGERDRHDPCGISAESRRSSAGCRERAAAMPESSPVWIYKQTIH